MENYLLKKVVENRIKYILQIYERQNMYYIYLLYMYVYTYIKYMYVYIYIYYICVHIYLNYFFIITLFPSIFYFSKF